MEEKIITEGCWAEWVDENGNVRTNRFVKKRKEEPFSEDNSWVNTPGYGCSQIEKKQIIRLFPPVKFRFNPSHR